MGASTGQNGTTGNANTYAGVSSGAQVTTGSSNTFLGVNAGYGVNTGGFNTFIGYNAGLNADPAGSNNIYLAHEGKTGDSGTVRIGDPSNQTSAYVAGVNGASTNSGVPVFIDSTGKLGTSGGTVSFTQVTGTVGGIWPSLLGVAKRWKSHKKKQPASLE